MALASPPTATRPFRVAVLGNPNAGKSTLFNALTGLSQKIGNYPGVTVERKAGTLTGSDAAIELIDLPGTYSLAAHSPDEMVAVDFVLGHIEGEARPDALLVVADASNLERNLYLVTQLLEADLPVLIALNMVDVAEARGIKIDATALAQRIGVPIVATRADRGRGLPELRVALGRLVATRSVPRPTIAYVEPAALTAGVAALASGAAPAFARALGRPLHRVELLRTLVDVDGHAEERLLKQFDRATLAALLEPARTAAGAMVPLSAIEAQGRYRWIKQLTAGCIERPATPLPNWTDRIDGVLTHRVIGTLVFAGAMLLLFQAIFRWATPAMEAIGSSFKWLASTISAELPEGALTSLLVDGAIGGVGAVVVFLPQILLLFLFLGLLEDCGYMARAAFLMDRLMTHVGLSGKSFIPMLSGFACAVPAVMATRVIEDRRDRLVTILVTPLMTCSARLPVYAILIAGFVPARRVFGVLELPALTLLALYALGIVTAMACAFVFKRTLLRGPPPPFVLELPSYKWPSPRMLAAQLLDRAKAFLQRAGTVILAMSLVIWAAGYFPRDAAMAAGFNAERAAIRAHPAGSGADAIELDAIALAAIDAREAALHLEQSALGRCGHAVEPLFAPLGWDWRITVAALAAFPAREVVVSTLGTVFSLGHGVDEGSTDLRDALASAQRTDGSPLFTLPVALSVMVFFALCCQCGATIATIRRETQSWKLAWFTFGYMTVLAWVGAFATFKVAGWFVA
ncbi:MAG: ferrous iron transport protein B [Planctomycetes bacterium]|nr:ferrous iron transport protein B [Planctomycetota bacterium]